MRHLLIALLLTLTSCHYWPAPDGCHKAREMVIEARGNCVIMEA